MATFRRSTAPGATYFFTVNTHQRQKVLTESRLYSALKESVCSVMRAYPFVIDAFVLLPDHLHCIWTLPRNDADYGVRWSIIKRRVSQLVRGNIEPLATKSHRIRGELGLWQRRFWEHQIRDEQDLQRHVDYIHWNPVKHGYVRRVKDWPYSSFHVFVRRALCPIDWAIDDTKAEQALSGAFGEAE